MQEVLVDVIGLAECYGTEHAVCLCHEWRPNTCFIVRVCDLPADVQKSMKSRPVALHDDPMGLVCRVNTQAARPEDLNFECIGEAEEEEIEAAPLAAAE